MPRKRKKKPARIIRLSEGPLPPRFAVRYPDKLLVFSDASQRQYGGLAAVIFSCGESEPLISTRRVPVVGSNELELQAALFGLAQARQHFPDRPLALFSDNQDAVTRLDRARTLGLAQDPALSLMLAALDLPASLENTAVCWVRGHGNCRGNALADLHAGAAAEGQGPQIPINTPPRGRSA